MEFILSTFYSIIFIWIIYRWKFFSIQGISPKLLSGVFLLKIAFGLFLWLIYTYHYTYRDTSDAFRYFDDAAIMFSTLKDHPSYFFQMLSGIEINKEEILPYYQKMSNWYKPYNYGIVNDNCTIIRFNALLHLFSFGYYHVHTVFMCFISFIGLTALYKTFSGFIKDRKWELFVACYLIPSVLFWGSGVLKEGLILFAFGMFVYHLFKQVFYQFTFKGTVCLVLLIFFLILIKGYILLAIIPGVCSVLIIKFTGRKYMALKYIITHLLLLIIAVNIHYLISGYNVLHMLQMKQTDFYNVAETWKAGSVIEINSFDDNMWSIAKNFPNAIFNSLFRPHIFEIKSLFYWFPAIENLILLFLIIIMLVYFKKPETQTLALFYFAISFVIILSFLIGLITPIIGAIIRYKVPLLPFLILIFVIVIDKEKIVKTLKREQ